MSSPSLSQCETQRSSSSCTLCCKCVDAATHVCVDCDLSYCAVCCDSRHRKGSFQRHAVKTIDDDEDVIADNQEPQLHCDECLQRPALVRCAACELAYCRECSIDVHRDGKLQEHIDAGRIVHLSPAFPEKDASIRPPATAAFGLLPRDQRLSDVTDENETDYDLWGGWSVFGDRPTSSSTTHSWVNPACDDMSTSSGGDDDEPKANNHTLGNDRSISSAFKSLALTHSSDAGAPPPPPLGAASASLAAPPSSAFELTPDFHLWSPHHASTGVVSQNELEDLFAALESPTMPSRHVLVRSISRHLSLAEVRNISHIMHGFGDVAQYVPAFATHGLLLYTYFELHSAVYAVQQYNAILNDDVGGGLSVAFSWPYEPPTSINHAVVAIELEDDCNNNTIDDVEDDLRRLFYGDVASVTLDNDAASSSSWTVLVEFNDSRGVADVLMQLQPHTRIGKVTVTSIALAPLPPHAAKLAQSFQAALEAKQRPLEKPHHQPTQPPAYEIWSAEPASSPGFGSPFGNQQPHHHPFHQGFGSFHTPFRRPTSSAPPPPPLPTQCENEYSLGIDRVHKGEDRRTTLMIRNIPNKYTQTMLLAEINEHHQGAYDFFYLPIDFKNKCNMGYAFINFMAYEAIVPFYEAFNGQKWRNFNSEKVCAISYARLQGKAAMIARFQNSSLLEKHESYRPLVFKSSGPDKGALEPFPAPRPSTKQPRHAYDGGYHHMMPQHHINSPTAFYNPYMSFPDPRLYSASFAQPHTPPQYSPVESYSHHG
ncbi:Aste57867_9034 [Aphanomyces stellatus]|uniref:Aste57867_9034 protein n=1 Tax=Aphanomyces stellatus TaxID=120398 RepID=A0A485KLZ3_9STRA|nr:hypothetical protein As57867_008998 [Aphanomyces stellatus]VFT85918.1 Aste57867_9034 [Aphanomyces stellatus]